MTESGAVGMVRDVVISLGIFVATGEILARIALSQPAFLQRLDTGGEAARELITRARATQLGTPPLQGTVGAVHDPILGWRASTWRTPPGQEPSVQVDARGRRRSAPDGWTPPPGGRTLTLVGDSFTFGWEVSDDDTFAWALRERLGEEVHNHGVIGYGLDQVLLQWRDQLVDDPPDVLVVGFSDLLYARVERSWDSWAKPRFDLDADGALVLRNTPLPDPSTFVFRPWTPRLPLVAPVYRERMADRDRAMGAREAVATALLDALARETAEAGTEMLVAYFPTNEEATQPDLWRRAVPEGWRLWRRWCAEARALCVSPRDAMLDAAAEGVDLTAFSHWSPEGHAVVAEVLVEALEQGGSDRPARSGAADGATP